MSRDYEHEKFRPWYLPDTAGWLSLSLAARGVIAELLRKWDDRGELRLKRLSDLAILLRLRWEGELEPALNELLESGRVLWAEETGTLSDPDFVARMRRGSAARMQRKRARDASDVTSVTSVTDPIGVSRDVTSPLISSDLKISDLEIARAREHDADQVNVPPNATAPPAWWVGTCETVEQQTGATLNREAAWLRYFGHRSANGKRIAPPDALYWLTTVDVREAQKDRQEAAARRDREAKWDRQRAGPGSLTPEKRVETADEREANARRLAERIAARKARDAAKGVA